MMEQAIQLELWGKETSVLSNENRSFKVMIEIAPKVVRVLVTEPEGDVLKAEFRSYPKHTRALLLILEGLALWSGRKLCVAIHAEQPVDHSLGLGAFGGEEWPEESALIEFDFVQTERRRRRKISGVGDFRTLGRLEGRGWPR
jgi:hypothetical protein